MCHYIWHAITTTMNCFYVVVPTQIFIKRHMVRWYCISQKTLPDEKERLSYI